VKPATRALLLAALLACGPVAPARAEGWSDRFVDKDDGAFDMSEHLLQYRGFLPVPIVITEPALGYGLGAGLLFFREPLADSRERSAARASRMAPPDIGFVAAFKTENGSKGGAGGYFRSLDGDRYRVFGAAAKMDLNLDYYGPTDQPRRFTLDAPSLLAQGLARIGESDFLVGLRYLYLGSSARFDGTLPPTVAAPQLEAHIGQMALVFDYDSRDNLFTPSRGAFVEVNLGAARPGLGSDSSFDTLQARGYVYLPLARDMVLGLRGDGSWTRGDVPFFAQPYVSLRGIRALRYQGRNAVATEAELRYDFTSRWSAVGFGGVGKAYGDATSFADARAVAAGGVGFRYLIARKLGLYAGLDVARGPEDTAIYIQVGSAWK